MKVAFRVDGSKKLGLGHVKRCIVLAQNLQKRNITCFFITQFKEIREFLESKGLDVFIIQKNNELQQIKQILTHENCTKLVIDSKRKSIKKLLVNLDKQIKTVLIDNADYPKQTDLIVISSVKDPKKPYPENSILGTKYLLHGIEKLSKSRKPKTNSIILTMGGSDKYNITKKIVHSFSKCNDDFSLMIILGKFYNKEKNLLQIINDDKRFNIIKNPPSLAHLMQCSSIGISAFGITVYEAAICHLPLLVISHSSENDSSAKLTEKYGWISYVGKYDKINYDELVKTTINLIKNKSKLKEMVQNCLKIDGLGPSRVANKIIKL